MEKSREKKVVRTTSKLVVDYDSGEIINEEHNQTYKVESEPEFIKMFIDDMGKILRFSKSESQLFHAIVSKMNYNNLICTGEPIRSFLCAVTGLNEKNLQKTIKELKTDGVLLPYILNGKLHRGWYVVNPNIVGKGKWEHIRAMQLNVNYDAQGRSISFGITDDDNTTTTLTLPDALN